MLIVFQTFKWIEGLAINANKMSKNSSFWKRDFKVNVDSINKSGKGRCVENNMNEIKNALGKKEGPRKWANEECQMHFETEKARVDNYLSDEAESSTFSFLLSNWKQ